MPGWSLTSAMLVPAWLAYSSSPRVQPPSWPGSSAGGAGVVLWAGEAAPGAGRATLSRLTLQPSLAPHAVVTVVSPPWRWSGSVATPHVSQLPVGGRLSVPADVVSVRGTVPPLA